MRSGRNIFAGALRCAPLAAVGLLTAGCMSSPTYGTGKSANEQLFDDVTGILSIAPKQREPIDYKPRPELVKPPSDQALAAPQDPISTASNPAWPESPEQRRRRYNEYATANQSDGGFEPVVEDERSREVKRPQSTNFRGDFSVDSMSSSKRNEFKRRLQESKSGDPDKRKYLSEPPVEYREPAVSAPVDDIGEDEWKKEKRRKADSRKKSGKTSWRDFVPWL